MSYALRFTGLTFDLSLAKINNNLEMASFNGQNLFNLCFDELVLFIRANTN